MQFIYIYIYINSIVQAVDMGLLIVDTKLYLSEGE